MSWATLSTSTLMSTSLFWLWFCASGPSLKCTSGGGLYEYWVYSPLWYPVPVPATAAINAIAPPMVRTANNEPKPLSIFPRRLFIFIVPTPFYCGLAGNLCVVLWAPAVGLVPGGDTCLSACVSRSLDRFQ
jgi:hypothetical protein